MRGRAARSFGRFGVLSEPGSSSDSARVVSLLRAPRRLRRRATLAAVRAELRAQRERLSRA